MTDSDQPRRYCTQCGAQIRSGSSFCISCGASLSSKIEGAEQGHESSGSGGSTVRTIPPLLQRYESGGSERAWNTQEDRTQGLAGWFKGLSSASRRGIVALAVIGALLCVGLIATATSSGDWQTEESYVADMEDSYTSIGNIDENIADTMYAYETDSYTLSEDVADQIAIGQSDLDTHIDYFEDSTPPAGYGEFQENTLEAWEGFDQALEMLEEGYLYQDQAAIDEGFSMANDYYDLVRDAQDSLPNTESAQNLENMVMEDSSTF